jgi:hypothetical protein
LVDVEFQRCASDRRLFPCAQDWGEPSTGRAFFFVPAAASIRDGFVCRRVALIFSFFVTAARGCAGLRISRSTEQVYAHAALATGDVPSVNSRMKSIYDL